MVTCFDINLTFVHFLYWIIIYNVVSFWKHLQVFLNHLWITGMLFQYYQMAKSDDCFIKFCIINAVSNWY